MLSQVTATQTDVFPLIGNDPDDQLHTLLVAQLHDLAGPSLSTAGNPVLSRAKSATNSLLPCANSSTRTCSMKLKYNNCFDLLIVAKNMVPSSQRPSF
jgi:hypothetical protein